MIYMLSSLCVVLAFAAAACAQEVWNRPDNNTDSSILHFMAAHELTNCYCRVQPPYGFLKCRLPNQKIYTFQVLLVGSVEIWSI